MKGEYEKKSFVFYRYLFNLYFFRILTQGSFLLSIWPPVADKRYSPAPSPGTHPRSNHPVLRISLPDYGGNVVFPKLSDSATKAPMYEFGSLDKNTQQQLIDHIEQDPYAK